MSLVPLSPLAAEDVYESVLTNAGMRPWAREVVDTRIVASVRARTGAIIDSQSEVGGFPQYVPRARSLSVPDRPADDDDQDGYTNLEEWIWEFEPQFR